MQLKRVDPMALFGSSDKLFTGVFTKTIPGLRHAHITSDLSIVYKVSRGEVYLYGFFTHDELGTGHPTNNNRQKSITTKFNNQQFD